MGMGATRHDLITSLICLYFVPSPLSEVRMLKFVYAIASISRYPVGPINAMEALLVRNAELKMLLACLVIGRDNERRYIPREEQQGWLIHGLRELYRHVQAGDGWPGEPLSCEANGQPLIHDILSRLGSLDQPRFEGATFEGSAQTSMHQQKLQDQSTRDMQQPHSSSGSPYNITSVPAPPIARSNISSPTVDQVQNFEAENTPSSLSTQDVPDVNSLNIPSQLHTSINLDEYTPDPASHAGLLYNDVQTSSPILEYPTESDPVDVNLDVFNGIGNGIDGWDFFFNPSTKGQLSTEAYLTPFYDSQPLPFEYAA
ncbi:Zn(II)2Cys6 transcription factor [Penicillium sp. IBT 35674x]|nr:Zn(II)2Cys6 transcription factor [Penicillium sp. IBT 35674x]